MGRKGRRTYWATGGPTGHRNYYNSIEHKSHGLEKFWLKMLGVPAYTYEHKPYSAILYPTSFTLDSRLALRFCAQRMTYGLCFTPNLLRDFSREHMFWDAREGGLTGQRLMVCVSPRALWLVGKFSCEHMFWDERGGGLTGQPMGPQVDTTIIRTVLSTNRVDSQSFSSRCWAFWCTHTSAYPIWLLSIRLALPLTIPLPSGFVPSARLMVGASPRALGLVWEFLCGCMFWDERGEGLAPVGPQVDTATIKTVLSTNRVDSGSFSSRCCAFRRTHTSADRIRLLCIRLALPFDSLLALRVCAQRKTYGLCFTPGPMACGGFFV